MMTCPCVLMWVARWIIVYSLGKLTTINLAGQVEMNVKCWPKNYFVSYLVRGLCDWILMN